MTVGRQARGWLGAEELAVEVDAHLEAQVGGHDLSRSRAPIEVADDPDVLKVKVSTRRARAPARHREMG
jgi:hypothetical protein